MLASTRGSVEKARLRGDEEQRPFADQCDEEKAVTDLRPPRCHPPATRSMRVAFRVRPGWCSMRSSRVREQNAAGGERQRHRHVQHGALPGAYLRLAQDLQAVRDRLDAGVGPAAEAIGA